MARALLARRCLAAGTLGAVAAGAHTAAAIGTDVLRDGGNAFDAALAAALAETVLLPPKCGLAGDLVALVRPAGAAGPTALTAIGPAATGLPALAEHTGWRPAVTGAASVGVPGAPAGYTALAGYGRLGLARAAEPAVGLAERGVPWSPVCARLAAEAASLLREHQPDGCRYQPEDRALRVGEVLRLPGLAEALRELTRAGAGLFAGPIGRNLAAYVTERGGAITPADLVGVLAETAPPETGEVDGRVLWTTPPPTYGPALLDALAAVPPHTGSGDDDVRALADAVRQALARQRTGVPALSDGTSAVAAVDAEGNAVVVVHSNSFPRFGSGLVLPGWDLVLSNRAGRGFTWQPGHPNAPAAGRRPLTTLHAWALPDADGGPGLLMGATPGGEQQIPWNAQVIRRLLAGSTDEDMAAAMTEPRWELDARGRLRREGVPGELPELGARSSHVVVRGGAGVPTAAADPRLTGAAVAA
ncbi:gamma-glutamyltransferase [Streptomyces shenzhenensis]|uniref:gamma-glutamyltransferase n=1 Tax=Streptomyces shenzhenensis TaxID=943815 RepID=UPI00367368ED